MLLLQLDAVVVHFNPLPDGQGRVVGQQERVEAAELDVVAAVDDGDRGGVFVAQASDGVDGVPGGGGGVGVGG